MINASDEEFVLSFEEKTTNLGLPTFKLPSSTKHFLGLTRLILFWTGSVYDY